MEIIPSKPYPTNSRAELRVFDKLRESFVHDFSYLAFHSLNLTRHTTKRFGEADFVLINKFGLFVLEVKGGGVKHENGIWYTANRYQHYMPYKMNSVNPANFLTSDFQWDMELFSPI